MPDQPYTLIYTLTPPAVVLLAPRTGNTSAPPGQRVFYGTQAKCQQKMDALNLTPLPDPALVAAAASAKLAAQKTFAAAVAAGYTVPTITPPLVLDLGDSARANFTSLLVLLNAQLAAGRITNDDSFPVTDINGNPRVLSVSNVLTMILGYGEYYAGLFAAQHLPSAPSATVTTPAPTTPPAPTT